MNTLSAQLHSAPKPFLSGFLFSVLVDRQHICKQQNTFTTRHERGYEEQTEANLSAVLEELGHINRNTDLHSVNQTVSISVSFTSRQTVQTLPLVIVVIVPQSTYSIIYRRATVGKLLIQNRYQSSELIISDT